MILLTINILHFLPLLLSLLIYLQENRTYTVYALEGENFISFNEWKRLRESKERDSLIDRDISPRRDVSFDFLRDRDSYGEEMELDFGFFSCLKDSLRGDDGEKVSISKNDRNENSESRNSNTNTNGNGSHNSTSNYNNSTSGHIQSKTNSGNRHNCPPSKKDRELEGRVYKEKFNFASLDCAATIIKTNSEASAAGSILVENKDKILLNVCSAPNQFVIIELCEDILVEEVVMGNFEYFSSTFKDIRLSVADGYPASETKNGWVVLGDFLAENSRQLQSFRIDNPRIWAKYLRIEVLSHYGNEYYCPISLVRVHGKTMMEEFRMSESVERASNDTSVDTFVDDACFNDEYSALVLNSQLGTVSFEEFMRGMDHDSSGSSSSSSSSSPFQKIDTLLPVAPEESIFKSITKRIASLEENMTYAIMYIGEQSTLLTEAFNATYRTKLDAITTLFNHTVLNRLKVLRHEIRLLELKETDLERQHRLLEDSIQEQLQEKLDSLAREVRFFKRICILILSILVVAMTVILVRLMPVLEEFKE